MGEFRKGFLFSNPEQQWASDEVVKAEALVLAFLQALDNMADSWCQPFRAKEGGEHHFLQVGRVVPIGGRIVEDRSPLNLDHLQYGTGGARLSSPKAA